MKHTLSDRSRCDECSLCEGGSCNTGDWGALQMSAKFDSELLGDQPKLGECVRTWWKRWWCPIGVRKGNEEVLGIKFEMDSPTSRDFKYLWSWCLVALPGIYTLGNDCWALHLNLDVILSGQEGKLYITRLLKATVLSIALNHSHLSLLRNYECLWFDFICFGLILSKILPKS